MSHSAEGVRLAGAGQSEGQHVDAALDEAAVGQFIQLLTQAEGHTLVLERLPGLACGQPGLLAQPVGAPLPTVLGFLLQHLQEGEQRVAVPRCDETRHRLCTDSGQPELMAQFGDPVLHGVDVCHQATPASRPS